MLLIAHDIRSLHNVGSLFRSADAFGVERIYLTGYTGTPPRAEIAKTALGAEDRVAWEKREDCFALIRDLQGKGYAVWGLETGEQAVPIQTVTVESKRLVIVVGNEVEGLPQPLRQQLDGLAEIPMPGRKKSLNVAVAAGIALFAFSQK